MSLHDQIVSKKSHQFEVATLINPIKHFHIHADLELITVLDGELTVNIDQTNVRLSKGKSVLIFHYQLHSFRGICTCRICNFSPWHVISYYTKHRHLRPKSNVFSLPPLVLEMFLQIKSNERHYARKGFLYLVINAFIIGREYIPIQVAAKSLTNKMLTFVEENYMDDCTLEHMSKSLNYHFNYLSQSFKKNVGIPFKEYVTFHRLNRVCYLLEYSQLSILACAEEAGFASLRSFNRVFKKQFGTTPSQYRKNNIT